MPFNDRGEFIRARQSSPADRAATASSAPLPIPSAPPPPIRRQTLVRIAQVLGVLFLVAVVMFIVANFWWIVIGLILVGSAMSQ